MRCLRSVYFGYWVVATLFVAEIAVTGISFYSFSLFIREWQDDPDLQWSLTAINASFWIGLPLALFSPLIGRGIDTLGPRSMMLVGVPLVGLAFIIEALMTELWQLWLAQGLLVVGQSAAFVGTGKLVGMWFEHDRGRMMGIALAGNNAGGIIMGRTVPYLFDAFGWRWTLGGAGVIVMALNLVLIWFFIRDHPRDVIEAAEGHPRRRAEAAVARSLLAVEGRRAVRWPGVAGLLAAPFVLTLRTFREVWTQGMASWTFWLLTFTSVTSFVSIFAVLNQLGKHLELVGIDKATTGTAITILGACGLLGKLIFGYLSERIPSRVAFGTICFVQVAGIAVLLGVRSPDQTALLWVFAVIYGVGFGAVGAVQPLVIADSFGLLAFGVVFGSLQLLLRGVQSAIPFFVGRSVDATGSYEAAFVVTMVALCLGALAAVFAKPLEQARVAPAMAAGDAVGGDGS
ncbi:MAG: MFS transporter [Dehalococcoidia bacterium]